MAIRYRNITPIVKKEKGTEALSANQIRKKKKLKCRDEGANAKKGSADTGEN
jgi:hypothetical protein